MPSPLDPYKPVCAAIAKLLPGQVEVVLHDLRSGTIAHLENPISPRAVGDDSLVETRDYRHEQADDSTIGPYAKANLDGERLKSVSAVLRDARGEDIGLLCINLRTDALAAAQSVLAALAGLPETPAAGTLVKNDWRELANAIIAEQLQARGVSAARARRDDRLAVLAALERAAVFEARGAATYVATALGISRAGLYELLKTHRQSAPTPGTPER